MNFDPFRITPNQRGAVIMYTMDGPPNHSVAHVAVGRMESAACDLLSAEIQRGNIGESILSVLALVNNSATSAVVLREMSEGTKLRRVVSCCVHLILQYRLTQTLLIEQYGVLV